MYKLQPGLNKCSNAEYHGDTSWLSSTTIKLLYKDVAEYYKQIILKDRPPMNQAALSMGSLCHSMILEPHLVDSEYYFTTAQNRRGSDYKNEISALDSGDTRVIITADEKSKADRLIAAYKKLPIAAELMSAGEPEVSICQELYNVPCKMRADWINVEAGYILDVKTTAYGSDHNTFKGTCEGLSYGLSAALYTAIAEKYYGKKFDFYFLVLSKKDITCDIYKASTETLEVGQRQILTGLQKYKRATELGIWDEAALGYKKVVTNTEKYEILEV
jgi:exodeoxyribonuclease VIII